MLNKKLYSKDAQTLNAIIKTATDGIIIIDELGIIKSVNPAAAMLFGYKDKEMIGQNVSLIAAHPHKGNHDRYIKSYLSTGIKKIIGIGREVNGQKKDGTLFPLRLSISEVKLENQIIFTGILHDLTKEKAQEEKINKLNETLEKKVEKRTEELEKVVNRLLTTNKELKREIKERKIAEQNLIEKEQEITSALLKERELNELKSRFVTMASHEFRTPLSSILTSAELIEQYSNSEQQIKRLKNVNRIKNAVLHLTSVLNEFLSLGKLEERSVTPQPIAFVLDDFIQHLKDELKNILKKGQIIQYQPLGADKIIFLDKAFLKHALNNLLSNAIKYSKEGQTVFLDATITEETLKISIKDEGIGIPQEDQMHLFSRFFRAHNVENIPGTGLGLNIVQKYVDLMGGKIDFNSILGTGTTFTLQIPLVKHSNNLVKREFV